MEKPCQPLEVMTSKTWPNLNGNFLCGQVAIITGGAGGIGLGIARALDARGCRVVIASRNRERVDAAVATLKNAVGFSDCDVRDAARVDALVNFTLEKFGQLDIAITSAGIGRAENANRLTPSPVMSLDEKEWDEVVDTNLRGIFLVCRAALQPMVKRRSGQLLNISSARGALRGQAFGAAYCASKMGVKAMFHSLAAELMPYGIRAMSLLPDAVDTSLIAGTGLAPRGAMTAETVGEFIAELLALPMDVMIEDPLIAPLGARKRKAA